MSIDSIPTQESRGARGDAAVTIDDVAQAANVSRQLVSSVLSGRGSARASAATRERIVAAANQLGYRVNPIARALTTGRTQTLGVLVCEFQSPTAAPILIGVDEATRERGYRIQLALHRDNPGTAAAAIQDLLTHRIDAILSITTRADGHPDVAGALPATGRPFALAFQQTLPDLDRGPCAPDNIVADQQQGGCLATEHLIDRGRRRIAFIGGPEHRNATQERFAGFLQAHRERDLPTPDPSRIVFEDFYVSSGIRALERLIEANGADGFDAIFAADDALAAGAMRACRAAGLRVPDDVAVVGFNDLTLCEGFDPPLTSVRMPLRDVGRISVERLIQRIEKPDSWTPERIVLPCALTHRLSS